MVDAVSGLTCPVCRARFRGLPVCSRCGADLMPLQRLAATAYAARRRALQALRSGDARLALSLATAANRLHRTQTGVDLARIARLAAACTPSL